VAADSLAAESTKSGGGFSENRDSEPLKVSGSNSTLANTDTSAADRLEPAPNSEARKAQNDWAEEKDTGPSGHYAKGEGRATGPTSGSQSGSSGQTGSSGHRGSSGQTGGNSQQGGSHHIPGNGAPAPSYVVDQYLVDGKVKGENVKEGGFDNDGAKNASSNAEIGSDMDPGRVAEQKFARENAVSANDAGYPKDKGKPDGGQYEALKSDIPA
jgi:hypothetical protein